MTQANFARVSCGALSANDVDHDVELSGWVHRRRDHGGLIFIDLRDRDGITQVTFDPADAATFKVAESLRNEFVVRVRGRVRLRPAGTDNPKLATGAIEVPVAQLEVLNRSETPPFVVSSDDDVDENVRLRYRYLDLRRPRMQNNLTVRHRIIKTMRDYFDAHDFIEVETPILIKSTPEGARDYLVPSRIYPGTFYALPQSPQILKQLLMVGGIGRYMQIARCFRDEDPRADRQPEFTQIDVEMSFVGEDDVIAMMEGCIRDVWFRALDETIGEIPQLTYHEAIRRFGSDKPDLRFGLELVDVAELFRGSDFQLFHTLAETPGNRVIALRYPGGASLSRRDFDALTETAKSFGAKGLAYITLAADGAKGPIVKFLGDSTVAALRAETMSENGDAILFVGERAAEASDIAGRLRLEIGERLGLRDPAAYAFAWVRGFPLFERDPDSGEITFTHHPFTAPAPGQESLFDTEPLAMTAQHYDLVLNGYELGSGSIRNHNADYQRKIFVRLGLTDEQIDDRFGFFLEALRFGAPPHGGMALGIDRIAMVACATTNIRDVLAFPKNQSARDVMMDTPSSIPDNLLRDVGLQLRVKPPN
ncbi:MAG TPA: aspartate--tRNA ligase [Candidatus Lustribacter sp.]|nr:aspartate--tRNA ligase [Candidatus Lustribacter sp.]